LIGSLTALLFFSGLHDRQLSRRVSQSGET
jgi:hypothetical protein